VVCVIGQHAVYSPFEDEYENESDRKNDRFLYLKREDTWQLSGIGKAEQRITESGGSSK
jgi:hypothetical protein